MKTAFSLTLSILLLAGISFASGGSRNEGSRSSVAVHQLPSDTLPQVADTKPVCPVSRPQGCGPGTGPAVDQPSLLACCTFPPKPPCGPNPIPLPCPGPLPQVASGPTVCPVSRPQGCGPGTGPAVSFTIPSPAPQGPYPCGAKPCPTTAHIPGAPTPQCTPASPCDNSDQPLPGIASIPSTIPAPNPGPHRRMASSPTGMPKPPMPPPTLASIPGTIPAPCPRTGCTIV